MKLLYPLLIIILSSNFVSAQKQDCNFNNLTFQVNEHRESDTLGDLVFSSNSPDLILNLSNIFFINKKYDDRIFKIEGAKVYQTKIDSIIIVLPVSKEIIFSYKYNSNIITKNFKVNLRPQATVIMLFDGQELNSNSFDNFSSIDSVSFVLKEQKYLEYLPHFEQNFTIPDFQIFLTRGKQIIESRRFSDGKTFYLGDVFKQGKKGDFLSLVYYPEWIKCTGETQLMRCHELLRYELVNK